MRSSTYAVKISYALLVHQGKRIMVPWQFASNSWIPGVVRLYGWLYGFWFSYLIEVEASMDFMVKIFYKIFVMSISYFFVSVVKGYKT